LLEAEASDKREEETRSQGSCSCRGESSHFLGSSQPDWPHRQDARPGPAVRRRRRPEATGRPAGGYAEAV